MHKFKAAALFSILALAFSCSFFMKKIDEAQVHKVEPGKDGLVHLVFGGSINGETHPCGCRHFPLGGLSALAGVLHTFKEKVGNNNQVIYFDTGDLLFPSNNVPNGVAKSLAFMAQNTFKGMRDLGLQYMVLGDYDLSLGVDFLNGLLKDSGVTLLISNLASTAPIQAKPWVRIDAGNAKIYVIGLVNPDVFITEYQGFFTDPKNALIQAMKEIKSDGFNPKNNSHRAILLSHSGMDFDQALVAEFPEISWVLGGHSQSFTRIPFQVNQTQFAQVLSKNHYLGHVALDIKGGTANDLYDLIEVRQERENELNPNPFIPFLAEHKKKVNEIQILEQTAMTQATVNEHDMPKFPSPQYCIDCHKPQGQFWNKTAHSIAYLTLKRAKEENNLTCIKCHSHGLGSPRGFSKAADLTEMVLGHSHEGDDDHKHDDVTSDSSSTDRTYVDFFKKQKAGYWKSVFALVPDKSIRDMAPVDRAKIFNQWVKIDKKFDVKHNFANVQCLNCHQQPSDHPFTVNQAMDSTPRKEKIQTACLECHTSDQSPEWYQKSANGLPGKIDEGTFAKLYKKVSCPKYVAE